MAYGIYPMLSSGLSLHYKWIILFKALLPVLFKLHVSLLFSWKLKHMIPKNLTILFFLNCFYMFHFFRQEISCTNKPSCKYFNCMPVVYTMLASVCLLTGSGSLRALRNNNPAILESLQLIHVYPY